MNSLIWLLRYLPGGFLVLGGILRMGIWLQNRSLFIDEASLALNFCERNLLGMWMPLDYQQYAPPLFLSAVELSTEALGQHELALRLFPLLCGLMSLFFFYKLSSDYLKNTWLLLGAVWIFAYSEVQLRYATELKQYSSDVMVALGLLFLFQTSFKENRIKYTVWLIAGAVAVWFSMPSVFVLFGIGLEMLLKAYREGDRKGLISRAILAGCWLLSFGTYYAFLLSPSIGEQALQQYHDRYFFPIFPANAAAVSQAAGLLQEIFSQAAGQTVLALLFGGIGMALVLRQCFRSAELRVLLWPFLACLLASSLGYYSLITRMMLWVFPLLTLLIMAGWQSVWTKLPVWGQGIVVVLMLATAGLHEGLKFVNQPFQVEEIRPLLLEIEKEKKPEELVWVDDQSRALVKWHTTCRAPLIDLGQKVYFADMDEWPSRENLGGHERVWVVFGHLSSPKIQHEKWETLRQTCPAGYSMEKAMEESGGFCVLFTRND